MLNRILESLGIARQRPEVYPFGTYGYGPDPRKEAGSVAADTTSDSPSAGIVSQMTSPAPVVDADRPATSLERAQAGEPSLHTGEEALSTPDAGNRKVVAFET